MRAGSRGGARIEGARTCIGLVHLCSELRVSAASEEGLISYQHRSSFTKRLNRVVFPGGRAVEPTLVVRGGKESGRMLIRAEPGATASPHQRQHGILM